MSLARLLVSGTHSGVGKTTVTVGLIRLLGEAGFSVQPFKVGPDYIDPGYLSAAAGRACRNLDGWLIPRQKLPALFERAGRGADLALLEGVMGLYDGAGATGDFGSSAEMAKLLDCPVLLVVDASAVSRSAAAMVKGFVELDRRVKIAGCFVNRVAGPSHYRLVKQAIERLTGVPVVGFLPRDDRLRIPERHLGLVPVVEERRWRKVLRPLMQKMRENTDLRALLRIARRAGPLPIPSLRPRLRGEAEAGGGSNLALKNEIASAPFDKLRGPRNDRYRVPMAVAMDEAFHFYYQENLELLEDLGAEVLPFSPLRGDRLPAEAAALYLGGGFPEVYARELSGNRRMLKQIRQAVACGIPTYAECGGLMWLTRAIRGADGKRYPMAGVIPAEVEMTGRLQNFGYQEVRARGGSLLARRGERARGHEFHHSRLRSLRADGAAAYEVLPRNGQDKRLEGYARGSLLASYIHLHFWNQPRWARRFVESARQWERESAKG